MYPDIKNKVAIITGGAEGIGLAITKQLLEAGAKVVVNDINDNQLKKTMDELYKKHPNTCMPFCGDAGNVEIVEQMVTFTKHHFGTVDYAIANAGITFFGDFFEFNVQDFQKVIDVNLKGAFFLTQKVAAELRREKKPGRIILMSSNVGIQAYRNLTAYSMTKAALSMMARSLVLELAPLQITINAIAPGATITNRTKEQQPDYEAIWEKLIPRGVVAEPKEIANSCLFLLSKNAAHINGQTLVVDGGWSVTGKYPEDNYE